jgi:hypothetical protein
MSDVIDWSTAMSACCPLTIEQVHWQEPVLVISGPGWSLSTTSTWRIRTTDRLQIGCEDAGAAAAVAALRAMVIVRCESSGPPAVADMRLVLEDGRLVETFTAGSYEPWVLRLPTGPIYVPDPTALEWYRSRAQRDGR